MDREMLRKVQPALLEVALEIKRVCEENDIRYFLCCGSFLGAVRHQGFIPWDDDLDVGMLREDYEKFCRIAPEKLGEKFCFQTWYTDPDYHLPFGKVRRKNTLYLEAKTRRLKENGFFVDVFPFDNAPEEKDQQQAYADRLASLFRTRLMKVGAKPWMENDRINWKKRIGYLYYQLKALPYTAEGLSRKYDELAQVCPPGKIVARQRGLNQLNYFERSWLEDLQDYPFEGKLLAGPKDYDAVLRSQFGDYRTLPPEGERENRHQIVEIRFDPEG